MRAERFRAMHESRRAAGERRRTLVIAATDAALQRGACPSIAGIARTAGVGRKFIYDHPDLRAEIETKLTQAFNRHAADLASSARVSAASLRSELENARAQCQRLTHQVRMLEDRLSRAEGARLVADDLVPDAMVTELADCRLRERNTDLERQLFVAKDELRRTGEELEAARAINRELMQQANRLRSAPTSERSRAGRQWRKSPTFKES